MMRIKTMEANLYLFMYLLVNEIILHYKKYNAME